MRHRRRRKRTKVAQVRRAKGEHNAKGESEDRTRTRHDGTKYLIETFGCQMNFHDSERMAGLLEQAGYEATGRRPRRRRHRHQHVQRARARRREAVHAPRRDSPDGRGDRHRARSSPSPAASRSRKASRSCSARTAVDVIVGTQNLKRLPMLVDEAVERRPHGARRAPRSTIDPDRRRVVSAGGRPARATRSRPTSRSSRAATSSAPSASCPYTRGHERMRPAADILAEARHAVRHGRAGSPAARADRQSLPGAGRPGVRLRGAAGAAERHRRASSASGSRARIRATSRRG